MQGGWMFVLNGDIVGKVLLLRHRDWGQDWYEKLLSSVVPRIFQILWVWSLRKYRWMHETISIFRIQRISSVPSGMRGRMMARGRGLYYEYYVSIVLYFFFLVRTKLFLVFGNPWIEIGQGAWLVTISWFIRWCFFFWFRFFTSRWLCFGSFGSALFINTQKIGCLEAGDDIGKDWGGIA